MHYKDPHKVHFIQPEDTGSDLGHVANEKTSLLRVIVSSSTNHVIRLLHLGHVPNDTGSVP